MNLLVVGSTPHTLVPLRRIYAGPCETCRALTVQQWTAKPRETRLRLRQALTGTALTVRSIVHWPSTRVPT